MLEIIVQVFHIDGNNVQQLAVSGATQIIVRSWGSKLRWHGAGAMLRLLALCTALLLLAAVVQPAAAATHLGLLLPAALRSGESLTSGERSTATIWFGLAVQIFGGHANGTSAVQWRDVSLKVLKDFCEKN